MRIPSVFLFVFFWGNYISEQVACCQGCGKKKDTSDTCPMETACHSQLAVPIVADTQILNKRKKKRKRNGCSLHLAGHAHLPRRDNNLITI